MNLFISFLPPILLLGLTDNVVSPFLAAAGLAVIAMIITRLPTYRLSIDFTQDLNLEPV